MQEVTLPQLLTRARGNRSLREMARLTGLSVTTIKRLEDGNIDLPSKETMRLLSECYRVPLDDLALAAYGRLFREVEADDAPPAFRPDPVMV